LQLSWFGSVKVTCRNVVWTDIRFSSVGTIQAESLGPSLA
jgi:hypothetical protein